MREFAIEITVVLAVVLGWLVLWSIALRAFDVPLPLTPEGRASRRERILRMGKVRYILVFGMLGPGLAMGLGMTVSGLLGHSLDWVGAAIRILLWTVLFGWWQGARVWNLSFRGEIAFPPRFPPQR
jgi:hypothetical protein